MHLEKGKGLAFDRQHPRTNLERDWRGRQAPEHEGTYRSLKGARFCSRRKRICQEGKCTTPPHIFLFVERKVKQYIESKEKYTAQNFHLDKKNEFFSMLLILVHSTVFCLSSWTPVNYFTLDPFFEGKGCEVSRGLLCWLSKL